MIISLLGWIIVGLTAWAAVAALLGVLISKMIRLRDHQVPHAHSRTVHASTCRSPFCVTHAEVAPPHQRRRT